MNRQENKDDLLDLRSGMHKLPEIPIVKESIVKTSVKETEAAREGSFSLLVISSWIVRIKQFIKYIFIYDIETVRIRREEWMKSFEGMNIEDDENEKFHLLQNKE